MAAHIVQQLLDQVRLQLQQAHTLAHDRVFVDRDSALSLDHDLPALDVTEHEEAVAAMTTDLPCLQQRRVMVKVAAVAAASQDHLAATQARELCAQVEEALLGASARLGGLARGAVRLRGASFTPAGDAQRSVAVRSMLFECRVRNRSADPRTPV